MTPRVDFAGGTGRRVVDLSLPPKYRFLPSGEGCPACRVAEWFPWPSAWEALLSTGFATAGPEFVRGWSKARNGWLPLTVFSSKLACPLELRERIGYSSQMKR